MLNGYGFVQFEHADDAREAVENEQGVLLKGSKMGEMGHACAGTMNYGSLRSSASFEAFTTLSSDISATYPSPKCSLSVKSKIVVCMRNRNLRNDCPYLIVSWVGLAIPNGPECSALVQFEITLHTHLIVFYIYSVLRCTKLTCGYNKIKHH